MLTAALRSPISNRMPSVAWRPNTAHPQLRGCDAWYLMREGSGTEVRDLMTTRKDAAFAVSPNDPTWGLGAFGPAVVFDGVDDYLDAGTGHVTDLSGLTLSLWVRWTRSSTQVDEGTLIERWGTGAVEADKMYLLRWDSDAAQMEFFLSTGDADKQLADTNIDISDRLWHHIAATYDGATMQMAIDGVFSANTQAASGSLNSADTRLVFGAWANAGGGVIDEFQGEMCDLRIYTRALTGSEVRELYLHPMAPFQRRRLNAFESSGPPPGGSGLLLAGVG